MERAGSPQNNGKGQYLISPSPLMNHDCHMHVLTVHIVDNDPAILDSLSILLNTSGFNTNCYPSGQAFIDTHVPGTKNCLLLDVHMPGMSGLELQVKLNEMNIEMPTIIITGHGNVAIAVKAMKNGAIDFIEKPYRENDLIEKLNNILLMYEQADEVQSTTDAFRQLFAGLTPREQDVFREMIQGYSNKSIARTLGISFRTIEIHRSHILQKMQVKNLPELIRKSILSNIR